MSEITYTSGLLTLDALVLQAIKQAKKSRQDAWIFYQLAIDGYRELRINNVKEGKKVVKRTPSSINTIDYPDDCIDILGVGVPNGGKIWPLTQNEDFIPTTTDVSGSETQDSDLGEGKDIPIETSGAFYARGGTNTSGYYQLEPDKRRIRLINITDTTIFVGYSTSGTRLDGTNYVPVKFKRAILAYIAWQYVVNDGNESVSRIQIMEMNYRQARQELAESEFPTYDEIESALLSTFYATSKR